MKKIFTFMIIALLGFSLFAGGKAEVATTADDTPTIRLLTDATGIDDKSFNAAAWRGIVDFYKDDLSTTVNRGKYYDVVTAQTQDMYIPNLKQAADEEYDVIMVTGFTWADALGEVAPMYPDQNLIVLDEIVPGLYQNI